jgi:hypothetical protein
VPLKPAGLFLFVIAACVVPRIAWGEDFRVTTRVYVGSSTRPVSENLTLFVGDTVYDFMDTAPRQATVFDVATGQFDMVDPARQVCTSITTDQLLRFLAALKVRVAENERVDPIVRFAANPRFHTSYDEANQQLVLQSPLMTYRTTGVVADKERVGKYHRFCDWFGQLNATQPGALPPFARLRLNQELAARNLVPRETTLTIVTRRAGEQETVLRSRHEFARTISAADRQRIASVRAQTDGCTWVAFHEFCGVHLQADRAPPEARK